MPYKNIDPTIWGPHLWKFMHYLTLAYPDNPTEDDKNNLYNFFDSIKEVLPCEKCRYNFKSHLDATPLSEEILEDNVEVIKWLFNLHNKVNESLKKPLLSYDDFIRDYTITSKKDIIPTTTTNNINPDKTLEEIKKELREELKQEIKLKETKKNNIYIFLDKLKNNIFYLLILLIIILTIIVYLNKKF
jgi:hypothetical protein